MAVKLFITILLTKLLIMFCRFFGMGGTTLPGKFTLKFYRDAPHIISKNFRIIMITGTNGKTTTTKIIGRILSENNILYISNKSGANLLSGVTVTFIEAVNLFGKSRFNTALIEIDEAAFSSITKHIKPDILVVTNFFRDQLDRYGELHTTLKGVVSGIEKTEKTRLILNADDSLCSSIAKDTGRETVFFGFECKGFEENNSNINNDSSFCIYCSTKYNYEYVVYGHLGKYKCPGCGYERPASEVSCQEINELSGSYSDIQIALGKSSYNVRINLPGLYNIYNALAAAACAYVLGLPDNNTIRSLESFDSGFGRMETVYADGRYIKIILVKNPTGFNQVIDFLLTRENIMGIIFAINDKLADGTDISWLWDVDFEKLKQMSDNITCVYTAGTRAEDMALRLKYADFDTHSIHIFKDYSILLNNALSKCREGYTLYILPTYTAMLQIRRLLKRKYKLKEFWK